MMRKYKNSAFRVNSIFLPSGKAEGTASSSLPRGCGKELQLHPWRLEATALSAFETLGVTMMKMINHIISFKGYVALCLFMSVFMCACASETNETSHNFFSDTCSITFDIKQTNKATLNAQNRHSFDLELDCNEIAIVNADVFNMAGIPLKSGGPWDCSDSTGTIQNVPAGTRGMVVVLCRSSQGDVVYRGESFEIDLTPGETVSAGTIDTDSFVPILLLPIDGETDNVVNGNVLLRWEPVKGAAGYRIEVVNIGNPSDPSSPYVYATSDTSYRTHDLNDMENDYTWQVRAYDSDGNRGSWSAQWNFVTDDNQIPSAIITNPEKDSQVFGNIQFHSGFPTDSNGYDPEDGFNVQIEWTSDVDGILGTGESLTTSLSPGQHTITLSVTDQAGAVGFSSIQITVLSQAPPLETGIWSYLQNNEAGCPVDVDGSPEGTCDIALTGQGTYDLTFTDTYVCVIGQQPCVFSCTLSQGIYFCDYTLTEGNERVTNTIEFSVTSGISASGQGSTLHERDDDSMPGYDYQCQWTYDISYTK